MHRYFIDNNLFLGNIDDINKDNIYIFSKNNNDIQDCKVVYTERDAMI